MTFADLIFPLFTLPYTLAGSWVIILALLVEAAVFFLLRRRIGLWRIVAGTLGANAFSWVCGIVLFTFLPLPNVGTYYEMEPNRGLHYGPGAVVLSFFVAFVASTLLEWPVWKLVVRKMPGVTVFRPTLVANAASYVLLLGALYVLNGDSLQVPP